MEGSPRTEALTRAGSQHVSAEQRGAALLSVLVRWHVCGVLLVVAGTSDEDGARQRRGATGFRLSEAWQGKHEVHKGRNALRTSGFTHGEEKSARGVGQLSKPMPTASMARNHRLRRPVRSSAARLARVARTPTYRKGSGGKGSGVLRMLAKMKRTAPLTASAPAR